MKTQIKRFSKSALAVVLTLCMLVSCMTVGIIATDAAKDNSETLGVGAQGSVYVDISGTTNWGTNVSYIVGKGDYSTSYNMTQLSGTKLYYKNIGSDWSDATEYGFHNGAWGASNGANQKISDRWGSTKHTSVESSWNFYSGSTYLVVITGSNNDYARNQSHCSGGYSDFNKTLTIKTALKSGSTYAETNTKLGTFSASNAVKITDDSTTTAQSISQTNGTGTITTARTNTATISQTVVRGYTFKGWKVGSLDTSGSSLSTGDYSFTNTGDDTTLYAYYEQNATTYNNIAVAAKGSTDGSTYNTTLSGTPATISANSYTTGSSALNISAGTVSGYSFAQWKVTAGSGTIGSATTANTTFTPSASNTTVTAQYKKNYTITSSVDDTGTGAGTVSTSKTSVEAGGSYKITATAKSGSAIESVKVNGTSKTATASQTISRVSADQTVVVKFKSKVLLKGTMNSEAWAGEEMTSNSGGTSFTITKTLDAGDHQFRLYADDAWKANNVTTWTLNGIGTNGTSGDNLKLSLTVKANVTFVSDGTKFTSITAVPYDSTKYTVTLKKVAGSTITGEYMGTSFSTASADAVVPVYSGTEISFTVTADSDKYISALTSTAGTLSPAFSAGATYTGKIASVAAASTITPTVANKLKVTCTTNDASWGTVTTDKEYAIPGETVTLSKAVASGTLKTITVYNASTTPATVVKSWKVVNGELVVDKDQTSQSSANQAAQVGITGLAGSIYSFLNKAGEAIGAAETSVALGADADLTFRMINGAVTVSAEYDEYSAESSWYYNGYDTSGNQKSGYYNKQMTESKLNGVEYSYFNVNGRTESDQIFTVYKQETAGGKFYVETPAIYDWNNSDPVIHWNDDDWNDGSTFHTLTYVKTLETSGSYEKKLWVCNNPHSNTGCVITNGKSGNDWKQTTDISDSAVSFGAVWIKHTQSNGKYDWEWYSSSDKPADAGAGSGTEYFYSTDSGATMGNYTTALGFNGGFNDYGITKDGVYKKYAKPNNLGSEDREDYYILVFYPGNSYTYNNQTLDLTSASAPTIVWSKTLPGQSETVSSTVKVYAKDGAIRRDNDQPERNDKTYSTFEQQANTFVYSDSGYATHIGTRSSNDKQTSEGSTGYNGYTYDYIAKFEKGKTLYIQTNLDSTLRTTHYLAAYCINGKSYAIHDASESDDGIVQEAFTVPEDFEDNYIEITPIYFLRDTEGKNTITFYVEGYDETVMNAGWGNTPFVYPFYQDSSFNYVSNVYNAFGGYPGQPMVFYQGNYYIQLPKQITTTISTGQTGTATIKGVTLGNGYWDDIHENTGEVKSHFQTYDFDDLYKIYVEHSTEADHIICGFKYETKKNNDEPANGSFTASNYNDTNGNGWEVLTDYYGRPVDIFGNVLTEGSDAYNLAMSIKNGTTSADNAAVVHAISQDYKSNSAGDYATEWAIFNTAGTKVVATSGGKTTIVPSALAINANTSGSGDLTDNFDKYDNATKAFKSIYTALYNDSNVRGKPAVVTYEKSIYGGGDKADRCDARWYFSQKNAPITATTRIEYTDNGKDWITDSYTSGTGTGSTTGTKAYFTGTATTATDNPSTPTGNTTTTLLGGHTGDGYYTFKAENAGQYQFVGWYLLRDNYQNISVRSSYASDATQFPSHAEMAKNNDIFVARFKKTATGTFDIYHEIHPQTSGYGTVTVSAIVKDSNGDPISGASYPASGTTNHVTIPSDYIQSGSGNTVVATFTATPYGTSNFEAFYETVQNLLAQHEEYGFITNVTINGTTATVTYDVNSMFSAASGSPVQTVTNVTHYSKFSLKDNLTYSLEYTFNTRYYDTKLYKYPNVAFTEQELRSYFLDQITDPNCNHIKLDKQFVKAKAPFESNFREDLTWVVDDVTFNNVNDPTIGYLTATQVSKKWATAMVYDFDNNGEMKTKTMVAPFEKLFDESVETKPTYQSDEAEAQAIKDWSVDNDAMYHPLRTSYVPAGETSSAPLYIDHWDIYQLDSFTYKTVNNNPKMMDDGYNLDVDLSKSVLVAQAYSSRFNYVGYEDYVVVPVYNKDKVDRQGASDKRTDSSATLLTLTRNQWNANAEGNTDSSSYRDGADRVYVDFMLNYNYSVKINGKDTNILLNSTGENIKVGFIVRSYTWENNEKHYSKTQYVLVDKDQINDKNRMEYCFGFNNTANNRKAGLYYEFKPFIVDTSNQDGSAGCDVTIENTPYKALYADSTVSVLDQVSFYQLGRL